jgi:predicted nucleic acid-binding protein
VPTVGAPGLRSGSPGSLPPLTWWTSRRSPSCASAGIAGTITDNRFVEAIDDLEAIELDRYPRLPLMRRSYGLRPNVTAYDATYIALAEVLGCELLTGDNRLGRAPGPGCVVRVLL